jgi:hypothetical protein
MTKYITEILAEINEDPRRLKGYADNYAIRALLSYAYNPSIKFILPPGEPPFKPAAEPIGMTPANLYQQVRKLYVFTREDIQRVRREQLFIQLLENIHPTEAKLILAIKDQNITSLYPNITRTAVEEAGIVQPLPFPVASTEVEPSEEGQHLVINLVENDITTTESFGAPPVVEEPAKQTIVEQVVEAVKKRGRGRPKKEKN